MRATWVNEPVTVTTTPPHSMSVASARRLLALLLLVHTLAAPPAAGYINCTAMLPPRTQVRSEACCVVEDAGMSTTPYAAAVAAARGGGLNTVTGAPEVKVALCSKAATPYGNCARQLNYPKPTPPRFHVMDDTCDENDPNVGHTLPLLILYQLSSLSSILPMLLAPRVSTVSSTVRSDFARSSSLWFPIT